MGNPITDKLALWQHPDSPRADATAVFPATEVARRAIAAGWDVRYKGLEQLREKFTALDPVDREYVLARLAAGRPSVVQVRDPSTGEVNRIAFVPITFEQAQQSVEGLRALNIAHEPAVDARPTYSRNGLDLDTILAAAKRRAGRGHTGTDNQRLVADIARSSGSSR